MEKIRQYVSERIFDCNPDYFCRKKKRICIENTKIENLKTSRNPKLNYLWNDVLQNANFFCFVAYSVFSAQRLRNMCQTFYHFLASVLIRFFYLVMEKSTKYLWFVKSKQMASYQALIKSNRGHLSICDKSNNANINWHHKCSFDWLCVIDPHS